MTNVWESGHETPWIITETRYDDGKPMFKAACKFCDYASASSMGLTYPKQDVVVHAKQKHYDDSSGLYYDDEHLKKIMEARKERRRILGSPEDTHNLNQGGM